MSLIVLYLLIVLGIFQSTSSLPSHLNELRRVKRITNGDVAKPGQFPSTVSFQYVVYNDFGIKTFKHFCGGSLIEISPQFKWILSAGHCFTNVKNQTVFAEIGKLTLNGLETERFKVEKVVFQGFSEYTLINDIALVKISVPKSQTQNYTTISLVENAQVGEKCFINGYGASEINGKSLDVLYFGEVREISFNECEAKLGRVVAPQAGSGQFCAFGSVDACNGDSGSGLSCKNEETGEIKLRGISSYGIGCGNMPGVYTDVLYYRDWIQFTLENE